LASENKSAWAWAACLRKYAGGKPAWSGRPKSRALTGIGHPSSLGEDD
jgi:hypothetical protein